MAEQFNPGDVVVLKSSGPAMTVDEYFTNHSNKQLVKCIWFNGTAKISDEFPPATLERVKQ